MVIKEESFYGKSWGLKPPKESSDCLDVTFLKMEDRLGLRVIIRQAGSDEFRSMDVNAARQLWKSLIADGFKKCTPSYRGVKIDEFRRISAIR